MKTFDGYLKLKFGDTYLLLAGGGEKKLTDLLTLFERPANTNNILLTVGGTLLTVNLGARAFDDTTYLPLSGGTMTGHITISGQAIYFGLAGSNAILTYNASYPNYGIWYHDDTVDKMSFSASNNANNVATADLCINGNGDGTVTIRGNNIIHAGNISSQSVNYATSSTTAYKLHYESNDYLSTQEQIDAFHEAYTFKARLWNGDATGMGTSFPGTGNGIILDGGWSSTSYGFQLAIDDDPNYFIALRQRSSTWSAWKRIPMGDGTGASGTWSINITGSAGSVPWSGITDKPTSKTVWGLTYCDASGNFLNVGGRIYLPENTPHYFRDPSNGSWRGGMYWGSAGNESMSFVVLSSSTRFLFVIGSDIASWGSSTWLSASCAMYITSSGVYALNFYSTSDRSKKQNISSFSEHIRKFQLKDTEKYAYGVIAQEVPEMFRDGEEGNMTVNYNSVLSYYIGELENKVQKLENEIKQLKGIINGFINGD